MDGDMMAVQHGIQEIMQHEMKIHKELVRLEHDVSDFDTAHLVNTEVNRYLHELQQLIDGITQRAEEQDRESDKLAVLAKLKLHSETLLSFRGRLRKANVSFKLNQEKLVAAQRSQLLATKEEALEFRAKQSRESAKEISASISEGLRRTRQMMANELERNTHTITALDEQSSTLLSTDTELKSMGGITRRGDNTLNKLQRRDFTDRILILLAFILFLVIVAYIWNARVQGSWIGRATKWLFGLFFSTTEPAPVTSSDLG